MTPGLTRDEAFAYLNGTEAELIERHENDVFMAYPAGKLAIAYWARANAPGWMADGIRINAVAPVSSNQHDQAAEGHPGMEKALDAIPIRPVAGASPRRSRRRSASSPRRTRRTSSVRR